MLEFNATLLAQIFDLFILIAIVFGILSLFLKRLFYYNKTLNYFETMTNELKEIRKILEDRSKP